MVAPQQVDPIGVLHLQAEEKRDGLDGVIPPIHEIANEDELVIGHASPLGDQVFKVEELAVDVAGYVDRRVHADDVGLLCQHSLDQVAQGAHGGLGDGLTG